jgi:hypothetical protein
MIKLMGGGPQDQNRKFALLAIIISLFNGTVGRAEKWFSAVKVPGDILLGIIFITVCLYIMFYGKKDKN